MSINNVRKVLGVYLALAVLVASLVVSIISSALPQTAYAAGGTGKWLDPNTIQITSGPDNGDKFVKSNVNGNDMTLLDQTSTSACGTAADTLDVNPYQSAKTATLTQLTGDPTVSCQSQNTTIALSNTNANVGGGGGGTTSGSGSSNSGSQCKINEGPLSWLICPVLTILSTAINMLTAALQAFMYTPVAQYFGTPNAPSAVLKPFTTFRNLAIALLVIAGLVMVISEAAGLEIFAAYTVRKTLPRLVVATIGIAVAWPVLQIVITFFNDIGVWSNSLIVNAFVTNGNFTFNQTASNIMGLLLTGVGAGLAIAASAGIVLSLLFTLLGALVVGFLVLAVRQMIILICIILAPLAIAAYVLPGTKKLWDIWEDSLTTALVMFPIVMMFLGAGTALSNLAQTEATAPGISKTDATTWLLMSALSLVGALALIPFAFKLAGGMIGTAHSLISGTASKGFFAKQAKFREERTAKRMHDAKTGNFFRPKNALSRKINSGLWTVSNAGEAGFNPKMLKSRMHEAHQGQAMAEAQELMEKNPAFSALAGDNVALRATTMMANGSSNAEITKFLESNLKDKNGNVDRAKVNSALSRATVASHAGNTEAVGLATMLAQAQSQTGWMDTVGPDGKPIRGTAFENMAHELNQVTHGDASLNARMWSTMRGLGGARPDIFGAGWQTGMDEIQNEYNQGKGGGTVNRQKLLVDAFLENSATRILNGKTYSTESVLQAVNKELHDSIANENMQPRTEDEQKRLNEIQYKLASIPQAIASAQRSGIYVSPHAAYLASSAFDNLPDRYKQQVVAREQQAGMPMTQQVPPEEAERMSQGQ